MINVHDILETIKMIDEEYLDVRTITMGISLLDCCDSDIDKSCEKIYNKIITICRRICQDGEILNGNTVFLSSQADSVTPIAMLVAVSGGDPVSMHIPLSAVHRRWALILSAVTPHLSKRAVRQVIAS